MILKISRQSYILWDQLIFKQVKTKEQEINDNQFEEEIEEETIQEKEQEIN